MCGISWCDYKYKDKYTNTNKNLPRFVSLGLAGAFTITNKRTQIQIKTSPGGHVWYQLVPGHNGALGLADLQNVKHYSRNCQHCQKWVWTLDYIKYIRWRLLISTWTIEICVWSSFKTFLTQLTAEVCDPAAEGVVIIPHMRWERRDSV